MTNSVSSFTADNIIGNNSADPAEHGAPSVRGPFRHTGCWNLLWVRFEWISFLWQKAAFWAPVRTYGSNVASSCRGTPIIEPCGGGGAVIYTTALVRKQDFGYDLESVSFIYHDHNSISQCQFLFYHPLSSKWPIFYWFPQKCCSNALHFHLVTYEA